MISDPVEKEDSMNEQTKYKDFLLKVGYWAAILILALLFIRYLLKPLLPFIIALAVSMILQPLIRKLAARIKIRKKILSVIVVLLTYLILAGILVGILIGLATALMRWASGLPAYFTNFIYPWIELNGNRLLEFAAKINPKYEATVDNLMPDIVGTISGFVVSFSKDVVSWASSVGTRLPAAFLTTVICIIATVFLSADYDNVAGKLFSLFPEKTQRTMLYGRRAFASIIGNYARSYSLILLITFTEMSIGLLIIGYENAFLYAFGVAVFDILPIVGSGMVLVPWVIITFIQGLVGRGIGLTILWLIVVTARQFIEPKIVGKQVGMHPLLTLVSMWTGLKLAGGIGMFAFPISLLVIKSLREEGLIGKKTEEETENKISVPGE